jgi:hypothetical protein
MRLPSQQFLKLLVLLLLSVFISETVYASSMMTAEQLHSSHCSEVHVVEHIHPEAHQTQDSVHQHHKQQVSDSCSKCGHCMACFSALPSSQSDRVQLTPQTTVIGLFAANYLSYISAPLHKPPIL